MESESSNSYKQIYRWAKSGEVPGGEFDWFASDDDGCIAAFCTAGFGPVPEGGFAATEDDYIAAMEYLEGLLHGKPIHSGGFEPWTGRGLFVYDFRSLGEYHKAGTPTCHLRLGQIPQNLRQAVIRLRFSGSFAKSEMIDIDALHPSD
jgi:hypothetical protein